MAYRSGHDELRNEQKEGEKMYIALAQDSKGKLLELVPTSKMEKEIIEQFASVEDTLTGKIKYYSCDERPHITLQKETL